MYRQDVVDVGYLQEERMDAIFMPRKDFLEVVQATLDNQESYSLIADKVLKTAETIERFPFGAWLHETRGCGCLIGEMLVADEVIEEFNRRNQTDIPVDDELVLDVRRKLIPSALKSMTKLLEERYPSEHVDILIDFGETIDETLMIHLNEIVPTWNAQTIIIEDI
jgi:hypothetical protein